MAEKDIKTTLGKTKSESRYLSDRVDVMAARRRVMEAGAKLSAAQRGFAATPSSSKVYQASADAVKTRQAELEEAKTELARIEAAAKADYQKAYKKVSAKKDKADAKTIDKEIEIARNQLKRLVDSGQDVTGQELKIQDLIDKKNKTGKYAPKDGTAIVGDQQGTSKTVRNYDAEIEAAPKYVYGLSSGERLALARQLKAAGLYNGPETGVFTDELVASYQLAISKNKNRALLDPNITWEGFLNQESAANAARKGAGDGLGKTTGSQSISTPSEAAATVEAVFRAELGRLPTAQEREKYVAELIAQEKKASSITKATPTKIGGAVVNVYTGGLDKNQFLADKLRKLPEYKEGKAAARTLSVQSLASTALANGLNLDKNFGADVVTGWVKRIEAGEDIDIFKNLIRKTAAVGLPENLVKLVDSGVDLDTIYAPYKRTMANILELPETSITLDDPVLRGAIGPDKPMTLFDFQKQLRKDARWQYTDQAREEVSSAALKVLRDFGFQG